MRFSALHDCELIEIVMNRGRDLLILGFIDPCQNEFEIRFGGILTYRMNNVQYQNVVSRAMISADPEMSADDTERLFRWTSSGSAEQLLIGKDVFELHLRRIHSGELSLFHVEPSWGAEVGVVAQTIELAGKH